MTATWDQIEKQVIRQVFGEEQTGNIGIPDLSQWCAQADWISILGERRVRLADADAVEAPPVLALSAVLAALWRFNTVVVLASCWDGSEFKFLLGRARSPEYGPEVMRGLLPADSYGDLWIETRGDPIQALLIPGAPALKLAGRPRSTKPSLNPTALEAMVLAAGRARVSLIGILAPVGRNETASSVLDIQRNLRELVNPNQLQGTDLLAHSLIRMVETETEYRLQGISAGLWKMLTFLLADTSAALHRVAGSLMAAQAQEEERPGPVLDWHKVEGIGRDPGPTTWVRSEDAAGLFALPRRPLPGFAIEAASDFDIPRTRSSKQRQLAFGKIRVRRTGTEQDLMLPVDDLRRHAFVCGVTGSGKTMTMFHILQRLWLDHGVPWLVVEPIKGDYWRLGTADAAGPSAGSLKEIRVITLGDATPGSSNPITLNPFIFPEGIPLSTHIDLLKSVFFAAFVLYPPMPYVLETALVRAYEQKGWDMVTSDWGGGKRSERFPTLSEFIDTVDRVADRLGWVGEQRANIRTSLLVRLENLRRGGKGLLLDGPASWTIDRLLDRPTILELAAFGSDEEKSLVCGLIFGLLAEFREAEAKKNVLPDNLRHVIVIEEAHRLFRRTATDQGAEGGNIRGQAVERIAGLLAEIRSYGQGVIIVDQSPEKLAPDAVRNTGTKVIHRIVAAEDREIVAKAANLSPAQQRELTVLSPGTAIVAAEEIREPVLINVPLTRFRSQTPKDRAAILRADSRKTESFGGTAAPFGEACRGCRAVADGCCGAVRAQVRHVLVSKKGSQRVVPHFWLLAAGSMKLSLAEALARTLESTVLETDRAAFQCASAQIGAHATSMLLKRQPTLFPKADGLRVALDEAILKGGGISPSQCSQFQAGDYLFDTCEAWCSHPCLFGVAMNRMLELPADIISEAQNEMNHPSSHSEEILSSVETLLQKQLRLEAVPPIHLGACALMFLAFELKGSGGQRRNFVNRVLKAHVSPSH